MTDVAELAAGERHACARQRDGTVWCWGQNRFGQLGVSWDVAGASLTPFQVPGVSNAIGVHCAAHATDAILEDDTLVYLAYGVLEAPGPEGDTARASTSFPSRCYVDLERNLWCSGENLFGQVGDGTFDDRRQWMRVEGLDDIVQVVGGVFHTCALRADGIVFCWGGNMRGAVGREPFGQDADGTRIKYSTPQRVEGISGVVKIAATTDLTCALSGDGQLSCWGDDYSGIFRTDSDSSVFPRPTAIENASDIVDVAVHFDHGCVIRRSGEVACWGSDLYGATGPEPATVPYGHLEPVRGLPPVDLARP